MGDSCVSRAALHPASPVSRVAGPRTALAGLDLPSSTVVMEGLACDLAAALSRWQGASQRLLHPAAHAAPHSQWLIPRKGGGPATGSSCRGGAFPSRRKAMDTASSVANISVFMQNLFLAANLGYGPLRV